MAMNSTEVLYNQSWTTDESAVNCSSMPTLKNPTKLETGWPEKLAQADVIIHYYIIHFICLFGIVGNLLNLIILTRKSLTTHMERMEKSVHLGLIALALSDLFFCTMTFPHALIDHSRLWSKSIDFTLLYSVYKEALINTFILSSIWLTVAMAISRYLAICYPLKARQYLGMRASWVTILIVFIGSILFNLPRYWNKEIGSLECLDGGRLYLDQHGLMQRDQTADQVYQWLYFVLGIVLPLCLLAYCNLFLIRALKKASKLRRQLSRSDKKDSSTNSQNIVTLTLCIIVVLYIILVIPAEVLGFWQPFIQQQYSDSPAVLFYSLAVNVCNSLQALNFSVNFILYCIINVHFRKVIRQLLLCQALREHLQNGKRCHSTQKTYVSVCPDNDRVDRV